MRELIPVRSVSAVAVATAAMVVVTAQPPQRAEAARVTDAARAARHTQPAQHAGHTRPTHPTSQSRPEDAAAPGVGELLVRMRALYRASEAASEAYDGARERLEAQRTRVRALDARLARTRGAVDAGRAEAGRLARQQYREQAAGLPPSVQVLLAEDPVRALQGGHALRRAVSRQAVAVKRLTSGERRRDALARRARGALEKQRGLAAESRRQRDTAQRRLRAVERTLSALPPERLERLRRLESREGERAQEAFLARGALGDDVPAGGAPDGTRDGGAGVAGTEAGGTRAPSERGLRALEFALAQRGKPYAPGGRGPQAYDSPGLTARAWAAAGLTLPHTARAQWRRLARVPLDRLRPGDLVVYAGATRVGLYAGDGRVVRSPRPGARVGLSPVAADPVLGAVRPDPAAPPLPSYTPPPLDTDTDTDPDTGAGAGGDTGGGYSGAAPPATDAR
ncbi:C40 family peptidase [Streptomyces phytohabitans]|uniref:C40 family peptidase n=1 Tax=Streptomyces phytohabitans TaxID=1150371 RepID=UPI00345C47A2